MGLPAPQTGLGVVRGAYPQYQAQLSWTINPTGPNPYTSQTIQRQVYSNGAWGAWVTVATLTGTPVTWLDAGLSQNTMNKWQIRASNTDGDSAWVEFSVLAMAPRRPDWVTARRTSASSVTLGWECVNPDWGLVTYKVERSINGGAYVQIYDGAACGTSALFDNTADAGSNQYRVAAYAMGLAIVWAQQQPIVTAQAAPLAPTLLAPNGTPVDFADVVVLTWQHNPAGDNASQEQYSVRFSNNGGTTWTAYTATAVGSGVWSHSIPAATLANNVAYLWQVQTRGIAGPGFGPWSASAALTGYNKPTATIGAATPANPTIVLPLVVGWTYIQLQSQAQASYRVRLWNAAGTVQLEEILGYGAIYSQALSYPVATGTTYQVSVEVQASSGLWSVPVFKTFAVALVAPVEAHVAPTFYPCTGTMLLSLTVDAPVGGVTVVADYVKVERRINGGPWVVIVAAIAAPGDVLDLLPVTNGLNEYRVTSYSYTSGATVGDITPAPGYDGVLSNPAGQGMWVLLSYGDNFSNVLRFHGDPQLAASAGRVRESKQFLGRAKPVLLVGNARSLALSVSGTLHYDSRCAVLDPDDCYYDSPPAEWLTAAQEAETVCYRDFTGRRIFGQLSEVSAPDGLWPGFASVSFSVSETEFIELPGIVAGV